MKIRHGRLLFPIKHSAQHHPASTSIYTRKSFDLSILILKSIPWNENLIITLLILLNKQHRGSLQTAIISSAAERWPFHLRRAGTQLSYCLHPPDAACGLWASGRGRRACWTSPTRVAWPFARTTNEQDGRYRVDQDRSEGCLGVSYRSVCPSVCPSVCSSFRSSVRSPVRPSIRPFVRPSVRSSFRRSVSPSVRPFVRPSVYRHPFFYPSVFLSFRQSVRRSISPPVLRPSVSTSFHMLSR